MGALFSRTSFWTNRRVWITGASSGIGAALALHLHAKGARLLLSARRLSELERVRDDCLAQQLEKDVSGITPVILQLDLGDLESLPSKAEAAKVLLGGHVQVLVNNGGRSMRAEAVSTSIDVERALFNVNFFSAVVLTKAVLPEMIAHGEGNIAAISSVQGRVALPDRSSYSASKHALTGYFNSLRMEVMNQGVKVTLALPGYVATNLSVAAATSDGSAYGVMDKATAEGYPPKMVAERIEYAIANGQREVWIVQFKGRLAIWLQVIAPSLLEWFLARTRVTKPIAPEQ